MDKEHAIKGQNKEPLDDTLNPDGMQGMVLIPSGPFVMGDDVEDPEKPVRVVTLSAYYMDRTPVTNRQYKRFIDETGYDGHPEADHNYLKHFHGGSYPEGLEEHPVIYVSWHNAMAYARWAGKTLPTEAQWEKAARGNEGRRYPWGDEWDFSRLHCADALNRQEIKNDEEWGEWWDRFKHYYDPRIPVTLPVGSFESGKSPYGLYDMAGNVWNWILCWYDTQSYAHAPLVDPTGPETGEFRCTRGGGWDCYKHWIRSAHRSCEDPMSASDSIGFRCVKLLKEVSSPKEWVGI